MDKEIDLQVWKIEAFEDKNDDGHIRFSWDSSIGWGEYELQIDPNGRVAGYSEAMDTNTDKSFLGEVLDAAKSYIMKNIEIKD